MTKQEKPHLPIGYWLKQADEAITERVNHAQQANGLSRIDWQVLNLLQEIAVATWEQMAEPLRPFADRNRLEDVVNELVARGLVQGEDSADAEFRLTDEGKQLHQAAHTAQKEVRQSAVEGVSQLEYETTVRVLQRMVANLRGDGAAQQGAPADAPSAALRLQGRG